jgi:hypothetical protein
MRPDSAFELNTMSGPKCQTSNNFKFKMHVRHIFVYIYITCVQTGSGAHPASCPMGNGGPFPGGKARPGREANHSLSSAEVKNA